MTTGSVTGAAGLNDPIVRRLDELGYLFPKLIDLSLGRMHRLLEALGNPERRLPPVLHVAGTNGKGSTLAFARAMLEARGHKVHVYTSPHLVNFNERVVLAGRMVTDAEMLAALDVAVRANGDAPITLFEISTAAAFLLFAEHAADFLLLETGLGGRLDATNVLENPLACAITQIGFDHQDFLGTNLEEIAAEKAGILRAGVAAIIAPQPYEQAARTLEQEARRIGAAPGVHGVDWRYQIHDNQQWDHFGGLSLKDLPPPGLLGTHQYANAATAIELCAKAVPNIEIEAIRHGLVQANWPARMQKLADGPLTGRVPGWQLWVDGGHNADAARCLASTIKTWKVPSRCVIVGMLSSKDLESFLIPIVEVLVQDQDRLIAVPIAGQPATRSAQDIAACAKSLGFSSAETALGLEDALVCLGQDAERAVGSGVICGSLYLAGAVLQANRQVPR